MSQYEPQQRYRAFRIVRGESLKGKWISTERLAVIEENGVRLRLNIVDTPGYGDQVNNDRW